MEKENKRLKILLGILSIFAMGLCCYFAYTVYKLGNNTGKCVEEKVVYSYDSMEGVYKLNTEVEIEGSNQKASATLYLLKNGTFKYEQNILAPIGQIGNYIIEGHKIILNYVFKTGSDSSLIVVNGTKELIINGTNSINDNSIKWGTVDFPGTLNRVEKGDYKELFNMYNTLNHNDIIKDQ